MCARIFTGGGADKVVYDGPNYYPYTHRHTFAAWVLRNQDGPALWRIAGDSDSAGGNRWILGTNNSGAGTQGSPSMRLYLYSGGGTYQRSYTWPYPSANVWHHICFTHDTTSMGTAPTVYHDGVAQGVSQQDGGSTVVSTATMALRLGNNSGGSAGWPGSIQNESYWDDILSLAEIQALVKGVNPHRIRTGRLVWHYPMLVGASEGDWAGGRPAVVVGNSVTPALVPSGPLVVE